MMPCHINDVISLCILHETTEPQGPDSAALEAETLLRPQTAAEPRVRNVPGLPNWHTGFLLMESHQHLFPASSGPFLSSGTW